MMETPRIGTMTDIRGAKRISKEPVIGLERSIPVRDTMSPQARLIGTMMIESIPETKHGMVADSSKRSG